MSDPSDRLRNTAGVLVGVDFDKTLTIPANEWGPVPEQKPDPEMVDAVQQAYYGGAKVIIWTARQWPEAPALAGWLTTHGVPYHGLRCGKGGADVYIEDKAVDPETAKEILRT